MPFDRNPDTGKVHFNFTNLLALVTLVLGFAFLAYGAFVLSKAEVKDNTMLTQITTNVSNYILVVLTFFFGSSVLSTRQSQQITSMQKDATNLALANAGTSSGGSSAAVVENKVDKAVAIEKLKAALKDLEPDSTEAKSILAELEALEKES